MTEIVPTQTLIKTRAEGMSAISPLHPLAENLTITDSSDYSEADELLSRIMRAEKWWDGKVTPIIDPFRKGLDLLYDLRNEFANPLKKDRELVKGKMVAFKTEERRQLRAAEEERQAEIARINKEAEEKLRKAEAAKTKPMKQKLTLQAAELTQTAITKEVEGPTQAVKGVYSSDRVRKIPRIVDMRKFLGAVMTGEIPGEVITINQTFLNECYKVGIKAGEDIVSMWPGVEIVEEINIAGRRS
ncbi:MAG: hypothetical protein ACREJN_21510 [Nitrospiraceae bacterium]